VVACPFWPLLALESEAAKGKVAVAIPKMLSTPGTLPLPTLDHFGACQILD